MNCLKKAYCRIYQGVFRLAIPLLPWRKPELISGGLEKLPEFIKSKKLTNVLLVTDKGIRGLGLTTSLENGLKEAGVNCVVYDDTVPNPTIGNIEDALKLYIDNKCEAIIAFGGGSSMDCAKGVGARVARPKMPVRKMKGLLKVHKATPPIFAVPTTAGTGSETTLAAVISDPEKAEKYPINDPVLIPKYAVLDPQITVKLPPHITSTTGMDALTHAVEAYIGHSNTKETKEMAIKATKLIFDNLETAYKDGSNLEARNNMQHAAYYAGIAFTRAYVGYVHAVAHSLGAQYHIAHGLANAVILPYFLEAYGKTAYKPLAELADVVGITGSSREEKAKKFIEAVKQMNKDMNIPEHFPEIKEEDIAIMSKHANAEGNPLYPVPKLMDRKELAEMYRKIRG
ncbi:MAG: iron-containing alcohol dehydrogenase [Eubacteriales bacterium]|nr:iron-containing alcohol dehydrogenase [Eubacteriales bacterium]MDY5344946.1 iron-containing alcohol dehydrogenase [Eubacteriales bacterium]